MDMSRCLLSSNAVETLQLMTGAANQQSLPGMPITMSSQIPLLALEVLARI